MKITIDSQVLEKYNVTMQEFAVILYYLAGGYDILNEELCNSLWNKDYLIKTLNGYIINNNKLSIIENWFIESTIPKDKKNNLEELAKTLRELFPKGIKTGNTSWRNNVRDVTLRLQKFFKLYGNQWSDKQIIEATQKYIQHFNGDYTYMRTLKYFIMKSEKKIDEEGNSYIEDISELATWLENDMLDNNTDWLMEVR